MLRVGMVLAALAGTILLAGCGTDDIAGLAEQLGGGPAGKPYNIGNDVQFGSGTSPRSADSLQGYGELVVTRPTYLLRLSIIIFDLTSGPANMKLALYTEGAGLPGNLIVAAPPRSLALGINTFPVATTPLAPGTYWIVSNADNVFSEYYA
jgi:hypothetical protein